MNAEKENQEMVTASDSGRQGETQPTRVRYENEALFFDCEVIHRNPKANFPKKVILVWDDMEAVLYPKGVVE